MSVLKNRNDRLDLIQSDFLLLLRMNRCLEVREANAIVNSVQCEDEPVVEKSPAKRTNILVFTKETISV